MSSSRRASAEINILAMLDGQTGKRRRFPGLSRAAWYSGAGMLACALLGAAAWMVHDQAGGGFEGRVSTGPAVVPLEIAAETLPNPALPLDPAQAQAQGAAIVDVAAPDAATADIPPPRFQPDQHELRQAHHHPPARPVVAAADSPAAAAAAQPAVVPARSAVHAPPRIAPRSAPRPAAKAAAHVAAAPSHPRRAATPARPRPAQPVDTDVALISAIIQHVNKRGELKDGADCGDKPCAPKLPTRP